MGIPTLSAACCVSENTRLKPARALLKRLLHAQLPRKDAEKAGLTEIPIAARRITRSKVRLSLLLCHVCFCVHVCHSLCFALLLCCHVSSPIRV